MNIVKLFSGLNPKAMAFLMIFLWLALWGHPAGAATSHLTATTKLRIERSQEEPALSFERDLGRIFTKRGCNSTECHGSVIGRGGLKLSLNALNPKEDYRWVVKGGIYSVLTVEPKGPAPARIDLKHPEKSLLLLKPTMTVAHGGGMLFGPESSDYLTILNWVRNGAPYGEERTPDGTRVERLEVSPKEVLLAPGSKQQLLVTAYLSNGRREDVTDQVRYVARNSEVSKVSADGVVGAGTPGETSVLIHLAGSETIGVWVGVVANPTETSPVLTGRNLIDEHVFAKLRKLNIQPSEMSGDAEFLRRVCLDLAGTLPPPDRVREFVVSKDPQKRDKLIDTLINSPEYVDYWTFRFGDFLRVNSYAQGDAKAAELYWEWLRGCIVQNKPYDRIARERLEAQGYDGPSRHYFGRGGEMLFAKDMMAEQVRVFLGQRLDCAQCHDHPFEAWSQNQYWGMAAFYGRVTRLGQINGGYTAIIDDPAGGHGLYGENAKVVHPKTKTEIRPTFLDGKTLPQSEWSDLRSSLAEWITAPGNRYFAEAIVNRMWSYFFGRGIVDPVDDFRVANPPTHPDLLAALAQDFKTHGYDLKYLIRLIVQSRTYQLAAVVNPSNRNDKINYSRAHARPLDAEVLLDAISQVTGCDEDFSVQAEGSRVTRGTRAINIVWPDLVPSQFLDIYGRPNRVMVPERKVEASLQQALHLQAGTTYTNKISQKGGRLDRLLQEDASNRHIIEEFYLAALARFPTGQELAALESELNRRESRRDALEDVIWGLIASREFSYNH